MHAFKLTIFCQNFISSQNVQQERVVGLSTNEEGEFVYELGYQFQNSVFYDMNVEGWGWNRAASEGRCAHYKRLMKENYAVESRDLSFGDLNPAGLANLNELISAESNTYYFSITNGFRNKSYSNPRDLFKLP